MANSLLDVKLSIKCEVYDRLINDKELFFNLSENSKTKKNNDFLTTVIINTHEYKNRVKMIGDITDILLDKNNVLVSNNISNHIRNMKDEKKAICDAKEIATLITSSIYSIDYTVSNDTKIIHIKENESIRYKIDNIIAETQSLYRAQLLKNLFNEYLSYPLYIREEIIFLSNCLKLRDNIKNKAISYITTSKGRKIPLEVYGLIPGKYENHLYVVGYFNDGERRRAFSTKLCNITNIYTGKEYELSKEEIDSINNRLNSGAKWINDEIITTRIKFDKDGLNLLRKIYTNRPTYVPINIDDNIYEFSSSIGQLFTYLITFGEHAVVLDDNELKDRLIKRYTKALNAYVK